MTEQEFIERFKLPEEHCSSCHMDMAYDYPTCYVSVDEYEVEVCCVVAANYDKQKMKEENPDDPH